jgi:hypothetical protein
VNAAGQAFGGDPGRDHRQNVTPKNPIAITPSPPIRTVLLA